ncbi:MAG: hypothetical protein HKN98_01700 [Silicimonas sp.]|nr:hypothetical protein [Silicimonas sp.]RZW09050.1 MAG: hypothetical protein EX266_04955 [Paracoccaceae bacterium]NND17269.1 hypothetical protein [Silicimonas sp.]NND41926.1 hypothetical protein [Silicimonas sp.]NNL35301.1 hypothetical protein [Silicimonas sp.]
MKPGIIAAVIAAVAVVAFGIYYFDVDQTQDASLPDVDISVEGGEMPEYDVETGDVDVGTEEVTIQVPTVDVESPEEATADDDS